MANTGLYIYACFCVMTSLTFRHKGHFDGAFTGYPFLPPGLESISDEVFISAKGPAILQILYYIKIKPFSGGRIIQSSKSTNTAV